MKACASIGQSLAAAEHMKQWMEEAGFGRRRERQFKLPMNSWPKDNELKLIGRYQLPNIEHCRPLHRAPG